MEIKKIIIASESKNSWQINSSLSTQNIDLEQIRQYIPTGEQIIFTVQEIFNSSKNREIDVEYLVIDNIDRSLDKLRSSADNQTCIWVLSDGHIFHNSSNFCSWLKLVGINFYGADSITQGLTDNKYLMSSVMKSHGIPIPLSFLYRGEQFIGKLDGYDSGCGFFVKPNNLGSQIGISQDSRVETISDAINISSEIYKKYGVESLIQTYIEGSDYRVYTIKNKNSHPRFICSKVSISDHNGMALDYSTNRVIDGRIWNLKKVSRQSKPYIASESIVDKLDGFGLIAGYSGIDIRGNDKDGYFFIENNVKPFPDSNFTMLAYESGYKSMGDMFLDSIISYF